MVFWLGAFLIALIVAIITGWRLIRRQARPVWPTAAGFALAAMAAFGAAVQATVASLAPALPPPAQVARAAGAAHGGATASVGAPSSDVANDSFDELVTRLETGLAEDPNDAERWALLARSYVALGRLDDAVKAFQEALGRTDPPDAGLIGEYGETLVARADGRIAGPPEAAFQQVLALTPGDPRALFYLANAKAEKGDTDGARTDLSALLRSAPPSAPWRQTVFERLQELSPTDAATANNAIAPAATPVEPPSPHAAAAPQAPTTVTAPPGPTAEQVRAAEEMTPEDRQAMIRGMVDGLAEKMAENPDDFQGWIRLANAYRVLGEEAKAADALEGAVLLQPANTGLLIQYAEVRIVADGGVVTAEAEKALRRAELREPGNPQVQWRLGQAAAARGDVEDARRRWQEIMPKVFEQDPLKAEIRAALEAL